MELSKQFTEMESFILGLQNKICEMLENEDTVKFKEDVWEKQNLGGGKTRVIENGSVFEKGGVNVSSIKGEMSEAVANQLNVTQQKYGACGLSIVIHPFSPKIPTIHMNIRYFETESGKSWFGGGIDLTPYFPFTEDFKFFHHVLKNACERAIPNSYQKFKEECDSYFTIKHRNEMRGIGGIFFDYLDGENNQHFELVKSVGNAFLQSYIPIVEKRKKEKYTNEDKQFQLLRRGRYVEFNLIYDRGTVFGLKTGGRVESILMSLPPEVQFLYDKTPEPGTQQHQMLKYYRPKDWISEE